LFSLPHRNAWFSCSGLRWGTDIITAQIATRDASHGGRGDPGKWDRCLRSAVGLGSGHFFCLREGPTPNANHSGRVCARIMCREKTQEGHRCPPTRFTRRGPAAANGSSPMPRNRVSVKEDYHVAKNSEEIRSSAKRRRSAARAHAVLLRCICLRMALRVPGRDYSPLAGRGFSP
jgi:hypothetical protein